MNVEGVEVPTEHFIDGRRVGGREPPRGAQPDRLGRLGAGRGRGRRPRRGRRSRSPRRGGRSRRGRRSGPHGRHEILDPPRRRDRRRGADLAAVECVDNGSLLEAMRARVLPRAANNIRFFADWARSRLEEPARTLPGGERNTRPPRPGRRRRRLDAVERAVHARDLARRARRSPPATPSCSSRPSGRR